ncbi:hypothetical protein CEP54_011157 [Fusarium duplospermum]|uniref:Uncharacterized protein n=1 Tax=Fusarium duplospermum TaxID=1325734 RepID=A0A428PFZ7_9HYPO|nr:hypothetical protein CEP54_011157 [Fusarium duplospermum]
MPAHVPPVRRVPVAKVHSAQSLGVKLRAASAAIVNPMSKLASSLASVTNQDIIPAMSQGRDRFFERKF